MRDAEHISRIDKPISKIELIFARHRPCGVSTNRVVKITKKKPSKFKITTNFFLWMISINQMYSTLH